MTSWPDLDIVAGAEQCAGPDLPGLPGFLPSDFAPLIYGAVRACLGGPRSAHRLHGAGHRAGIVLCSQRFDTASLELSVEHVDRGRVSPILFYQVVPTAVLGQVARDYRLTGPVSCVATIGDARREALEMARVLLTDAGTDWVLTLAVDTRAATPFARADLVRSCPGISQRAST
jgi:hypothetical protein